MSEPESIDALVSRIQNGETAAFTQVVRRFEWPVRSWVAGRCPPGADPDDVAQRTFIEAFKSIGRYEPGTDFKAWLFTIARYQVMAECTRLRRLADYHWRYVPHALALELERRAVEAPEAERRLELLAQCIAALDPAARDLLRLRYDGGQSLGEIADRAGRSLGAIKKSLFLIRQKLHACVVHKLGAEA